MKVTLRLIEGPEAGKVFEFDEADSFLVGRTRKAHLRLDAKADRRISRNHFILDIRPPRCIVTDLDSRNGTYVNGKRIKQTDLADGDEIRVGKTKIIICMDRMRMRGFCSVCGKEVTDDTDYKLLTDEVRPFYICAECKKEEERRKLMERSQAPTVLIDEPALEIILEKAQAPRFTCVECGRDLTDQAGVDGLATELTSASYLCDKCASQKREAGLDSIGGGDYLLLSEIGRGGMGIVYQAVHQTTGRVCAIKMIRPELVRDEHACRLFEREIEVQSKVHHPNLVRVLDQGRNGLIPFFVTEYLAGGDIKNLVVWEFQGPVEPRVATRITIQILQGLQALHDRGYIHRDLKPSNFLLDRSHREENFLVKIADYGLAKSFENAGNSVFDYTQEGVTAGSYVFIPPEQITNYKFVKPPVDVYAAGVSLYYMLTGHYSVDFPTEATSSTDTPETARSRHPLEIILEDPPVPLLTRQPELPPTLATVVDKAVIKDVGRRYQSAEEFRQGLEAAAAREGWPLA